MTVRVRLCGDIAVEVDGERRDGRLRGRHGRMLLAYLVLNRGRSVTRAELIDALWGDHPPGDPSSSLRAHLSRLRTALGADAVEGTERVRLHLPADASVDVEEAAASLERAESAAAERRWPGCVDAAGAAAELIAGPFAPGLEADWVSAAEADVEQTRLRALELLGSAALALAPPELSSAEQAGRSLVEHAPFRESGHRLLVRVALERDEVAEGLRAFDVVRTLFRDELGILPSAELRALHARLLERSEATETRAGAGWRLPPRLATPDRFVGRKAELATVVARSESGGATIIEGEAGVGKTRLLAAAAADLHARGWAILYGRCQRDAPVAYQPLVEALDGALEALGEAAIARLARAAGPAIAPLLPGVPLPDDEPPGAPGSEVWRLYRAASRFLDRLSGELPVLLAVDDLHLADRATLGLVGHLADTRQGSLAVVATYRSSETAIDAPLVELADRGRAEGAAIHLAGLPPDELAAVLAGHAPARPSAGLVDDVYAATGGNPLYAVQLARHLAESGTASDSWQARVGTSLPAEVRSLVGRRVAGLPEPVRATLSSAAVIGHEFELDLLARITRRPRSELLDDLELALRAGVVRDVPGAGGTVAFVHGLVQQALHEGQLSVRREESHRRVAEELERRDADPARLAYHWREAGGRSDPERVVAYSREAAERASSRLAFETAAALYRRALEAGTEMLDDAERTELLLALSRTQRQAGALDASRATAREAGDAARRARDPSRLARAALIHSAARTTLAVDAFEMEHAREAAAFLREAHEALPRAESLLRVRVLSELAAQRLSGLSIDERRRLAREAAKVAAGLEDTRGELIALRAGIAPSLRGPDELAEAVAAAERASALAAELDDRAVDWDVRRFLCGAHFVRGDLPALDSEIARMGQITMTSGDATHALGLAALRAGRARFAGSTAEADRIRTEAIAAASDPSRAAAAFGAHGWLPIWDAGRYDEVIASIEAVVAQAPQALPLHGLLALLHCEAGQRDRARERFEVLAGAGFPFDHDEFLLVGLTQTALACSYLGDRDRASALHEKLRPYAGLNAAIGEQLVTNGPVDLSLGTLEFTLGRLEHARRSLERAEQLAHTWGDRISVAVVQVHLGRVLVLDEQGAAGRELARAATAAGRALGVGRVEVLANRLDECWSADSGVAATF